MRPGAPIDRVQAGAGVIYSMFGAVTGGDAAVMDAAVVTIFVLAVVLVGVIAMREFGRRR
jgi:hypothetical protein